MTTALGIVTKALQKIGALTKNESPSSDEASDGLDALNAMIGLWANESLMVYARTWESFTLTANDELYTIGSGQDFNTSRPMFITAAYVRSGTTDYNIEVISDEIYNQLIQNKSDSGTPVWLNYDNAHPAAKIRLWPKPDTGYTLFLLTEKSLSAFTLNQTVDLPPGWEQALIYNLAVLLAPEYSQQIDQVSYEIANMSKGAIMASVARNVSMDAVPMGGGKSNILNGGYY